MTAQHPPDFGAFVSWYQEHARPLVRELDPDRASEWDADLAALAKEAAKPLPETTVCFLGNSGVGKSTLINALAAGADAILPAGGVGPLTAQALQVCYAEHPRFTAYYHPPTQVNRLIFGLQRAFATERRDAAEVYLAPAAGLDPAEQNAVDDELAAGQVGGMSRRDEMRKLARLLVIGKQDGEPDIAYLLGCLRAVIESDDTHFQTVRPEDRPRVLRLRRAVEAGRQDKSFVADSNTSLTDFRDQLKDHAAGFMAPLIRELRVECPSDLLEAGVNLVDLPGVGVAGDVYRRVTAEWVRDKARAIVLVVDRSGITDAAADLLRSSEFLNRLMYSAAQPDEDPVSLLIAVTRVDDVAGEMRRNDRSKSKLDYFRQLRAEFEVQMRQQLGEQLSSVQRQGDTALSATERQVIDRVVRDVQIHALSAVEYRKLLMEDEDDLPFIKEAIETGVPCLHDALADLARCRQAARLQALRGRQVEFATRVIKTLQTTVPTAEAVAAELAEEATRLRASFRDFITRQRREYDVRRGQFREFWKVTLRQMIESQVAEARRAATQRMRAYLAKLSDAHPATLQAAVNRGGTFHGARRIDLTHDLALCFDGAVAERWGMPILQSIRDRTKQFADDCVALVEEIADWAMGNNCPQVAERLGSQVEALRADARQAAEVGRDQTAEIRETINQQLVRSVEEPIRVRCREFRDGKLNQGRGVRGRVLELFGELGEEVGEAASRQALPMLNAAVDETETAIREHPVFRRNPLDTVDQVAAELVSEPTTEARRRMELGRAVAAALARLKLVG